ncbi:uncharacterized protein KQ657_003340 [Scheffersomyces spartinae]|uniref:3-deoxy-7-phosphoheptulonate synthase n=1 Tax=Scheffersomyces spartinae TaxID=45513 RepID=A0A9P8AK83_9ASCO|nr:uncharacterized protein KQ657_003340 [Scheffersomyces spartinae]KAG7195573.1 hypothetical protein KQ657_003340 [Scheffersomyces spartinae]
MSCGDTKPALSKSSSSSSVQSTTGFNNVPVPLPDLVQGVLYPLGHQLKNQILLHRALIRSMLNQDVTSKQQRSTPLLIIAGPSSISDVEEIKSCAEWIKSKDSFVLLRVNMSVIIQNDSYLSFEILKGLPYCRSLLRDLARLCPIVGELSDTLTPQYFSDIYSLALISSTYVESQLHRESVSGCSYSVGFGTQDSTLALDLTTYENKISAAMDAMYTASQPHLFLSMTKIGQVAVTSTQGNNDTFLLLQLNALVSKDDISKYIAKVYSHPNYQHSSPKIMLDVGKVNNSNYEDISSKLLTILNSEVNKNVVGVMIDSGDNYTSKVMSENLTNADKLIDLLESL